MLFWLTSIALLVHGDAAALRSSGAGPGKPTKALVEKAAKGAIQAAMKKVGDTAKSSDDASDAAQNIQAQLNSVLAAGNARLKEAEQEHEKVLTGVRDEASTDLSNRAEEIGNALSQFQADRKTAQDNFNSTINATQKGLALISADLDISERARIGAKIGVAQRQLNHVIRTEKSALESASRRAEGPLDKESDSLMSMWVGDMSKALADAKDKMQNIADQAPGAEKQAAMAQMQDDDDDLMDVLKSHGMAVSTTAAATTTTTTTTTKKKVTALVQVKPTASQLEKNIEVAMKTFDSDNKAALKKVNDVIAKNMQEVSTYLKDTKKKLDVASKAAADKVKLQ
eukprot:gnl/MRDRNA2_/MRDRNA2_102572_c0_seq1.p1 gnl/MRDRNA2_/MRDRNA2_102572_c0~~gnl/MRDRNA2_/MRDRNA2_102572_c0_seq1.p1  ORF type:complete len:341 (-),score=131.64 gnl/MRDRNA2_/MRDRNA2_102572_c0_seq1:16-1038(-)